MVSEQTAVRLVCFPMPLKGNRGHLSFRGWELAPFLPQNHLGFLVITQLYPALRVPLGTRCCFGFSNRPFLFLEQNSSFGLGICTSSPSGTLSPVLYLSHCSKPDWPSRVSQALGLVQGETHGPGMIDGSPFLEWR